MQKKKNKETKFKITLANIHKKKFEFFFFKKKKLKKTNFLEIYDEKIEIKSIIKEILINRVFFK